MREWENKITLSIKIPNFTEKNILKLQFLFYWVKTDISVYGAENRRKILENEEEAGKRERRKRTK